MSTKLLLIEDVRDLGRSGDIVAVKPGYARNYLLPQGVALIADRRTLRIQERLQQERAKKAAEDRKEAEAQAKQLETIVLETRVKTDPEGHMYGSVAVQDILDLLAEVAKIEVDKKGVLLKHPIKALGIHRVELRLNEGVEAAVVVKVMNEQGEIGTSAASAAKAEEGKEEVNEEASTEEGDESEA